MKNGLGFALVVALAVPVLASAYDPLRPLAPDEVTVGAAPQSLSGAQLHARCSAESGDEAACLGYLEGMVDALEMAYDALGATQATCLPDWLHGRPREVRKIVLKYLESHRDEWDTGAGYLVAEALQASFPCPRN